MLCQISMPVYIIHNLIRHSFISENEKHILIMMEILINQLEFYASNMFN